MANTSPSNGNGTAIEKQKPPTPIDLVRTGFEKWKPTLKAILPKHIDPERVIKIALNVYLNKPELHACTPLSMVRATLQCAELGLDPSPLLGEAYFLPWNNTVQVKDGNEFRKVKQLEVQLMPGYVGLIKLAKQTGDIADVYAVVVDECEKEPEFFEVERGTVNRIHHKMRFDVVRTGKVHAAYGVVKFKDGSVHFECLPKSDIDAIRKFSKTPPGGPWDEHYPAMARKTLIKQVLKQVPKSPDKPALAKAIALDNAVENGEAFTMELSEAIDAEGVEAQAPAALPDPQTRTAALANKIGAVAHDKDGVVS